VLWAAELNTIPSRPATADVPIQISPVQNDSVNPLLSAAREMDPIAPQALIKRLELGCRCFAAWAGESIIAYSWLTHGCEWVGEFERELHVEEGEAYIWDCATLPAYRRQRLFRALLYYSVGQLQRDGLKRLWIISLTKVPKLACAISAAGFEPVVSLTYVRLFDWRGLLISPWSGASARQVAAAHRLLKSEQEVIYGPLIVGNASRHSPPATHFDRFCYKSCD
jgi:GNAT superfamily N-acetyltransferase